jgi:hypothetical protein
MAVNDLDVMWKKLNEISILACYGGAETDAILKLESLVGSSLPEDFKQFLVNWGGII